MTDEKDGKRAGADSVSKRILELCTYHFSSRRTSLPKAEESNLEVLRSCSCMYIHTRLGIWFVCNLLQVYEHILMSCSSVIYGKQLRTIIYFKCISLGPLLFLREITRHFSTPSASLILGPVLVRSSNGSPLGSIIFPVQTTVVAQKVKKWSLSSDPNWHFHRTL